MVTLVLVVAFSVLAFLGQRDLFLQDTDRLLKTAALAVPGILPDGFHRSITGPDSVSPEAYRRNMDILTQFAEQVGVTYVYSFMEISNQVVFTSVSVTPEMLKDNSWAKFFQPYDDASPEMARLFREKGTLYETARDEFGTFRSCLVSRNAIDGRIYVVGADIRIDDINRRLQRTLINCAIIGLAGFFVVFLASLMISQRVARPVTRLVNYANKLSSGGFTPDLEAEKDLQAMADQGLGEVGTLAEAFAGMIAKLQQYIEDLRQTTAVKERIESELKIAHDIQMSFLHKLFPAFPDRKDFDLFATLEPAKEVGGDLYDFCMLDEDRLFFYVGDVSDKGVPAALFMAVTMALMKRTAQQVGVDPAEILKLVNTDLASENENLLFVTLCCFILNLKTGEVFYSNAGHNPPVIIRADGTAEWLKLPDGLVLGVMPGTPYKTERMELKPGDTVLLYTDGVTEAMNPTRELYSEERLMATALKLAHEEPTGLAKALMASVKEHAAGAPPSDDITVLTLKYTG